MFFFFFFFFSSRRRHTRSLRDWSSDVCSSDLARVSLEVPVSRLAKALGLLAEALHAPAFTGSEVERLVRNRLDDIPLELANPGRRAARQLSAELFPAPARVSRPRKGTEDTVARIDA